MERTVETLWARLEELEAERRFDGESYPKSMCAFPFRLAGQGFFPGGDGLWREDNCLAHESQRALPKDGIVFVGNDFGTLESYRKLEGRGYENPPTWRHLKARIRRAELPQELCFCTNAIVGLRITGTALSKQAWQDFPTFPHFCREFFAFQLEVLRPKLLVTLGTDARKTLESLLPPEAQNATSTLPVVLYSTHPYADFNFTDERKFADAEALRAAWQAAN